jgi:hypothetical protein
MFVFRRGAQLCAPTVRFAINSISGNSIGKEINGFRIKVYRLETYCKATSTTGSSNASPNSILRVRY